MTTLLFPDNTVLVSFAVMGRVDLFERLVSGRGTWTLTISGECHRSSQEPGLGDLALMTSILGDPIRPTRAERVDMAMYRARLAGPGDPPTRHLGEAEALAIIAHRGRGEVFITDDGGARLLAESLGVRTYSTVDLLLLAVHARLLTIDEAWELTRVLRINRRPTGSAPIDRASFDRWCV